MATYGFERTNDGYRIGVPGFEHLDFSTASPWLALSDAVTYHENFGGQLQSAREAVAFRLAAHGTDHASDYQVTRTTAIHFVLDDILYVAFDDSLDPNENILLARANEGHQEHTRQQEWLVPRNDPIISATLDRAINAGRLARLPPDRDYKVSLPGAFRADPAVRAILTDLAPAYEAFLRDKGYGAIRVYTLPATERPILGVDSATVNLRSVGLCDYGNDLATNDRSTIRGYARRVRGPS